MGCESLPSDMIFEILTRIKSLKTLDTCKTVCKEWERIINEWNFLPNYCQRTSNVSGYFIQSPTIFSYVSQFVSIDQAKGAWQWSNNTGIDNLPKDTEILASCDQGILCCVKNNYKGPKRPDRYYACKPATKQWQELPNPKTRFQTTAVAIMVMKSNVDYLHYKIVRISYRHNLRYLSGLSAHAVEIFDSGVWSWSVKDDLILPFGELIRTYPAVEVSRSLYWLTTKDNVLVFCPQSNSFSKFSLPEHVLMTDPYGYTNIWAYQGKLGFASVTSERYMELWVMDDPEHNSWVKKLAFNVVERIGEHGFLQGFYNAGIVLMKNYRSVIFHKLQDGSNGIVRHVNLIDPRYIFPFRSDMEPVNLRPKKGEVSRF